MKKRNPLGVILFSIITFGIYAIVWNVKTKNEMNKLGAEIPTAWLLIIPIINIYWMWKYSKGVEHVTAGKTSGVLAFVLLYILSVIGMAIIQDIFNGLPAAAASQSPSPAPANDGTPDSQAQPASPPAVPVTPAAEPQPDNNFGGPAEPTTPPVPTDAAPEAPAPAPPADQPPTIEPPTPPQVQ
ncbi:MAG TPA: DUF4234 domain-containing protein [Candidatus Dormibacteraeota bacterium]|nr:DUF4234 domain-containing protein [Candidatus Dormibacteraeota bacterium]